MTRRQTRELLLLPEAHEYVLFAPAGERINWPGRYQVQSVPFLKRPGRLHWLTDRLLLPGRIRRSGVDLFHATEITSIPKPGRQRVWATIYDLIPLIFWEETRRHNPWDFVQALRLGYRRAKRVERVITCSERSKRDICERLDMDESKVEVVPLACDEVFGPVDTEKARTSLRERHRLEGPFLFYVGGTDFRKNLPWLVRAFAEIRKRGYSGKLVLAGETFLWDIREVREIRGEIARCGLDDAVTFPGYVEDGDLPNFYAACDFFVFPSRYEGFGLPVLEALRCGAPALVSRSSSIPEVAGDAAVYFDPADPASLVEAFEGACGDPAKVRRLREAGFKQAARFSWRETALRLHRLYEAAGSD